MWTLTFAYLGKNGGFEKNIEWDITKDILYSQ